jgi:hypothetical protein
MRSFLYRADIWKSGMARPLPQGTVRLPPWKYQLAWGLTCKTEVVRAFARLKDPESQSHWDAHVTDKNDS